MDRLLRRLKVYNRAPVPTSTEPEIVRRRQGHFILNRAAFEAMGRPQAVDFAWDPEHYAVTMRPVDPSVPRAYPVQGPPDADAFLVVAPAFTRWADIEERATRRYPARANSDQTLTIALERPEPVR
jgi:hypothetical protein